MPPEQLDSSRRAVLAALGAGTALTAVGGVTLAQQGTDVATDADRRDAARQQAAGSVHRVRTLISGPPTNPERPADFFFQPTGLHVQPGDVVRFEFVTPDHNVVSYHPAFGMRRRVPLGVDAFSSPLSGWRPDTIPGDMVDPPAPPAEPETPAGTATAPGTETDTEAASTGGPVPDFWLHAFDTPGVYDLLCSPHEHFGMAMRVVVGDDTATEFEVDDPDALPAPRSGPVELARTTLTDSQLQPETIVQQGTVPWGQLEANGGSTETGTPSGTETETEGV